jgi:hypothetical protein
MCKIEFFGMDIFIYMFFFIIIIYAKNVAVQSTV